jgi:diacylglycerol kinase family enzyme
VTIERNRPWGEPGGLTHDALVVHTDGQLRAVVEAARRAGMAPPVVGLLGGDLCRTLGGRGDVSRLRTPDAMRFPIDVVAAELDGETHWFVAHLLARRSWWRGPLLAVMNAEFVGAWDVAPRSHPNDGTVDVLAGDPSVGDRWKARARLRTGAHVPHPNISQTRANTYEATLVSGTRVWLDGDALGVVRELRLTVEPDALVVVV